MDAEIDALARRVAAWVVSEEGRARLEAGQARAAATTAALREARTPTRDEWLDWHLAPLGPCPSRRRRDPMSY
jgi:hypothetical protein